MSYKVEILSIFNTSFAELNEVVFDDWNFPSFMNYSSNPDLVLKFPTDVNCPFDFDKVIINNGVEEITEQTCPIQNPMDSQACLPNPIRISFQVWCSDYNDCIQYADSWNGNCTHTNCTKKDSVYDRGCHTDTWCSDIDNCFTRIKPPKEIYLPPGKNYDKGKTYDYCVFSDYCNTWKKVTGYWVQTDFTKDANKDTVYNYLAIHTDNKFLFESVMFGGCTEYNCHSIINCGGTSLEKCGDVIISLENPWGC
jgi:hypothetical protein